MRCARAQRLMAAAVDDELASAERRALDEHLAGCVGCAGEMGATATVLAAFASLPGTEDVPVRLEQETLRRVRLLADEPPARAWWRTWLVSPLPAVALAAALVLAASVGLLRRAGEPSLPVAAAPSARTQVAKAKAPVPARTVVARASHPASRGIPAEPPAALAAAPDLFVDLPMLRHMEKLEHFDAIRTTTVDDGPAGTGEQQGDDG